MLGGLFNVVFGGGSQDADAAQADKPVEPEADPNMDPDELDSMLAQIQADQHHQDRFVVQPEQTYPVVGHGASKDDIKTALQNAHRAVAIGDLYCVDANDKVQPIAQHATVVLAEVGDYTFELRVGYENPAKLLVSQRLDPNMNMMFLSEAAGTVLNWITFRSGHAALEWKMTIPDADAAQGMKLQLAIALHEVSQKESFAKTVSKTDKTGSYTDWVINAYDTEAREEVEVDEKLVQDDRSFQPRSPDDYRAPKDWYDDDDDGGDATDDYCGSDDDDAYDGGNRNIRQTQLSMPDRGYSTPKYKRSAPRNSNLNVGTCIKDRTCLVRGNQIGVFRTDNGTGNIELIDKQLLVSLNGMTLTPSKAQLHNSDRQLLMLSQAQTDKVFCKDVETGKVVSEWGTACEEFTIDNMAPTTKFAQLNDSNGVIAVNRNSAFMFDGRVHQANKVVQTFTYKGSCPKLNCITSTGDGGVAVGAETGVIRMFTRMDGKRAKTMLPGLGDAIVGMDTTKDGHYILATTKNYLLLIPTVVKETGRTGFARAMGNKAKPVPLKLQLSSKDIRRLNIQDVSFTHARFNTGTDVTENWIVTATGPYVITWNMAKVLRGNPFAYKIKRCFQKVEETNFGFDSTTVVVAERDNLFAESFE